MHSGHGYIWCIPRPQSRRDIVQSHRSQSALPWSCRGWIRTKMKMEMMMRSTGFAKYLHDKNENELTRFVLNWVIPFIMSASHSLTWRLRLVPWLYVRLHGQLKSPSLVRVIYEIVSSLHLTLIVWLDEHVLCVSISFRVNRRPQDIFCTWILDRSSYRFMMNWRGMTDIIAWKYCQDDVVRVVDMKM